MDAGLTQKAVADHFNISRVSVTQWESGQTRPDSDKYPALANLFGVELNVLLGAADLVGGPGSLTAVGTVTPSRLPPVNASSPVPVDYPKRRIPIFGQAVAGDDGRFVLNGQRVVDILCPPQLANVPDAYGVFVHGDSMEPRYEPGEAVFVNPHVPVRKGNYVVVQVAGDFEGDDASGYVKRFVSMNSRELVLEQFKPREELPEGAPESERFTMRFPRDRVVAVHKIVGTADG
jgi:phage repressor protein C with HTH and peptisase S24 domain